MSGDGIAQIVYLILLFCVFAGFFVTQLTQNFSGTVRNLALWFLIIMGLVAAYGLKDTIRTALVPGLAMERGGAVELRRGRDGHFHAIAEINGEKFQLLVDTGATHVVLSQQDAVRAGFDPERLSFVGRANTANGVVKTAPVRLASLRLGPVEERNFPATVNGGELDGSVLGMSFLDQFSKVEISGDTLLLYP